MFVDCLKKCRVPNYKTPFENLTVISYIGAVLVVYIGGLSGAKKVFRELLGHVLGAPQSFFDIQPRGRILDRLSNDVYKLDSVLPDLIRVFSSQAFRVLLVCFRICSFVLEL
ncbi:ABC transporter C family member 13-like [Drosophila innubila]|uniref:ABC transporter C family member 13-like n=1 Tax=Drosophila innubila TaxID=198719 RepID=UPI00148E3F2F|nr:ABC transporter C family member 13-like [Drosophila innubila]